MTKKQILILGAGLVVKPMVDYFLSHENYEVTIAARKIDRAKKIIGGSERAHALLLDVTQTVQLVDLVKNSDIVVSLLPYTYHVQVAKICLEYGKNLVTTSYVSEAMKALHQSAHDKGLLLLNEIGLDPGIDHMSAMRIIDQVKAQGGKIRKFRSYCGGLPAPAANDNPFGYKFSWSPKGVLLAGTNNARYREEGQTVEVPGQQLFTHNWPITIGGMDLEAYPNRDSLGYIDAYGLHEAQTVFRGTLRNPGWSRFMYALLGKLKFFSGRDVANAKGLTHAQVTGHILAADSTQLPTEIAQCLGIADDDEIIQRLAWLGLFDETPCALESTTPIDYLTALMLAKMQYAPGEQDMIVLFHDFTAEYDDRQEVITSTLIQLGEPNGDTAMSKTVSLPAAIAVKLILEGKISDTGVRIPIKPQIYEPVLQELERLGIVCEEQIHQ